PAFPWKDFPTNEIFYPLARLFEQADSSIQETLLAIFSELTILIHKQPTIQWF
ncbi:MAG: hypothetical protein H0V70_22725, partial [Ktedonobacteraceae bacterium]|nr:hypothetical protein [Ktedonobacteraceae bacterium]